MTEIPSGRFMTPQKLLPALKKVIDGWKYDRVSIGYPGRVRRNSIEEDAPNLGPGWRCFDFRRVLRKPVKILNDAAMQALGSYHGGRMLFLGLGTGLGSTLILEGVVHAMELGDLPFRRGRPYADYLGKAGLERLGHKQWVRHVKTTLRQLKAALQVDYVVLGGGKAKLVGALPAGVLRGENANAFDGGVQAWEEVMRSTRPKFAFA
ncbi:MAG TPA: ROK family protein [Verrucomicrobiae bacterium]|nr:ROK family protein [Verrucomicrobiae bacterium]